MAALSLHPRGVHMNHSELLSKDQFEAAKSELAAFVAAVEILFGPEQAKLSATDWLEAIEQLIDSHQPTRSDWRHVTIIAASQLAQRLGAARLTAEGLNRAVESFFGPVLLSDGRFFHESYYQSILMSRRMLSRKGRVICEFELR
jgi:hypothetical protein